MELRKILFKAKRLDNDEWVKGDLYHNVKGYDCIGQLEGKDVMVYPIDPSTVCQYTGLKDKNGAPIYEGDELEYDNGDISFIRTVEWRKGAFRFGNNLLYFFEENYMKVLGSKFDKEGSL